MHVIRVRNVTRALPAGLEYLLEEGRPEPSRAGEVIVAPEPVTTVYERPTERVLTSPVRDANPFFHLFEALWMLAGRRDGKFLDIFVSDFSERFAEGVGGTVHGAYGHRWRHALGFDQIEVVIEKLKRAPQDRQCVIQMWDATQREEWAGGVAGGYEAGCDDLVGNWRDRPCNTHVYLRVREEPAIRGGDRTSDPVLDLTVCCRSNDIVWGAYGANAVHFSVLQEYLAARIGVGVGVLTQISNNFHAYRSELDRLEGRRQRDAYYGQYDLAHALMDGHCYEYPGCAPMPLVTDAATFDEECARLLRIVDSRNWSNRRGFWNTFLDDTALQMHNAWVAHRAGENTRARVAAQGIAAGDWRVACVEWLERRRK